MFQKNNIKIGIFISLLGWALGFWLAFDPTVLHRSYQKTQVFPELVVSATDHFNNFKNILLNNLVVAVIISLIGYFTFGIISIVSSVHNGFVLAICINSFLYKYSFNLLYIVMLHAPFELFALCYFGAIGLSGSGNLNKVLNNQPHEFLDNLPSFKYFIIPLIMLLFSAIIESKLLFFFVKNF